ncbi:ABC transporter substrate-binding protein [Bacillus niameyensis]|uniref:ABC transporter substrate-binding protein n=1 Tax=Bacillus niameyensis TaxID=1522308 RepID=UPI0007849B5C|nr:extracellular solute-binding protein [Bacillus niameyensis]
MKIKRNTLLIALFALILSLLVACSSETSDGPTEKEKEGTPKTEETEGKDDIVLQQFSDEEVTLKVATPWGVDYFMERVGNYVEEKLPFMTLEHIDWDGSKESLEELYANEVVPDVFLAFSGQKPLEEMDSVFPLDEMIESYSVDLSHISSEALQVMRSRDKERRLIGIPQETSVVGLYYNKEVFDLFGEEYPNPDESMTWDEVMGLAAKLTGIRNGTNYCGLEMESLETIPLSQLSAAKTDAETGEVLLTKDPKFTKYMELMDRFYHIPGNFEEGCSFTAKTTAMKIGWQGVLAQWNYGDTLEETIEYMANTDIAPLPTWPDLPGVGIGMGGHPWAINSYSEQKDAALQFILAGTSVEYQTILARIGTPAASSTGEPNEQFGADNPKLEGKNVAALFALKPAEPLAVQSDWDQYVGFDFEKFVESGVDIQEFLRITQEESEIKIKEAMASQ